MAINEDTVKRVFRYTLPALSRRRMLDSGKHPNLPPRLSRSLRRPDCPHSRQAHRRGRWFDLFGLVMSVLVGLRM